MLNQVIKASLNCLPHRTHRVRRNRWFKDEALIAKEKRLAWDKWKEEGRPIFGPFYDTKTKTRAEFKRR